MKQPLDYAAKKLDIRVGPEQILIIKWSQYSTYQMPIDRKDAEQLYKELKRFLRK